MKDITTTTSPAATDARKCAMKLIAGQIDGVRAIRDDRIKWMGEATDLLARLCAGAGHTRPVDHSVDQDATAREAQ